jgi:hypothetical protein
MLLLPARQFPLPSTPALPTPSTSVLVLLVLVPSPLSSCKGWIASCICFLNVILNLESNDAVERFDCGTRHSHGMFYGGT